MGCFIMIAVLYCHMYNEIQSSAAKFAKKDRSKQISIARKMMMIVLTDFCCLVPISIMGKKKTDPVRPEKQS